MLLTLVATQTASGPEEAPSLPDLYVRDTLSSLNVAVAGVHGWDGDFLQTQTVSFAPMIFAFDDIPLITGDETVTYWCRRLSKIVVNCFFSADGADSILLPVYEDKNGIKCYGTSFMMTAISEQNAGNDFCSVMKVLETFGANKIGFKVLSVSEGTVKVYVAGV